MAHPASQVPRVARVSRSEAIREARARRALVARLARTDINVFCEFVGKDEKNGAPIFQAPIHERWHQLLDEHPRAILWSHVEAGKAVPVTTEIPTPTGWTTMATLEAGDRVFGRDGQPTTVRAVSAVQHGRTLYRVIFDDGESALADADHQWLAARQNSPLVRKPAVVQPAGTCACGCGEQPAPKRRFVHNHHRRVQHADGFRVVTTRQMLEVGITLTSGASRLDGARYTQSRWKIPVAAPVAYPAVQLLIHPYALGAWLGDGDSSSPTLTFHQDDRFIFDRCVELEGPGKSPPKVDGSSVSGKVYRGRFGAANRMRRSLATLGVLGNKHIPASYLTASIDQRRELLAGLLDTDGYVTRKAGGSSQIELSFVNQRLATDAIELVRSLGFKARLKAHDAKLYGRVVGTRWRIFFTARVPVFRLPRKLAAQCLASRESRANYRYITKIEEVASVPVKCISVDAPDQTYLMGRDYTVTHNTVQVSVLRTLWELGNDPNLRFLMLSNTKGQSRKIAATIKTFIEQSSELRDVFPHLQPGSPWGEYAFSVKRNTIAKDPSIQTAGVHGNVLGARLDRVVIDDILDWENTRTDEQRKGVIDWVASTVFGRLVDHARVAIVGNAYHPHDMMHWLAKQAGWTAVRYPVIDPTTGLPRWPERWSLERIERKAAELGPLEAARQLMCQTRDEGTSRFKREWVETCLRLGEGIGLSSGLAQLPPGYRTYTGVDLAIQQKDDADLTVLTTIAVDPQGVRTILNVDAGRWSGPDIVAKIHTAHIRYQSVVIVENNAAQDFIIQFARPGAATPIIPFTTGRNKAHPEFGIESLAAEMAGGKWRFPNQRSVMHPEVSALVDEMLFYTPAAHTGDRLMSLWFAREGVRLGSRTVEVSAGFDLNRR